MQLLSFFVARSWFAYPLPRSTPHGGDRRAYSAGGYRVLAHRPILALNFDVAAPVSKSLHFTFHIGEAS